MRIFDLLNEGYPDTIAAFNKAADPTQVKTAIDQYRNLVNKNQVQGNERNIDWWRAQGWEKFSQFVADKSTQATKTQVKRKRATGNSITIKETTDWLVVIPLDHDASCFHGRGSDWCTARPTSHYFDSYFLDENIIVIYCINKVDGDKYAIAIHPDNNRIELFDIKDHAITEAQFQTATGFNPRSLISLIPHDDPRISHAKDLRQRLISKVKQSLKAWFSSGARNRDAKLESLLIALKRPGTCFDYVQNVGINSGAHEFPAEIAIAAVRHDPSAIEYILNPGKAIQLIAVKDNGNAIEYIKQPTEDIQLAAVTSRGDAIRYIDNPSDAVQVAAVTNTPHEIQHIKHPCLAAQLEAVEANGVMIHYINNPSEQVQLLAVGRDAGAIRYIDDPSEAVQLDAVERNPAMIKYINDPTKEVIEWCRSLGYDRDGRQF